MEQQMNPQQHEQQSPQQKKGGKGGAGVLIGALLLIALIAGGVGYLFMTGQIGTGANTEEATAENGDAEETATGPVARVNGVEITREEFENAKAQAQLEMGGQLPESDEIDRQIVDSLINSELLEQAVADTDITISSEEVDTQLANLQEQVGGAEEFAAQLESAELTESELREQLREQLRIEAYLQQALDLESITVNEEDIQNFYDQQAAQAGTSTEFPTLEEARPQIEQVLRSNEEQILIREHIEELRTQAEIETLL